MYEIDKRKKSKVNLEIDAIIKRNDGKITQDLIVKEANKKNTALHENFEKRGLFDSQKAMKFAQLTYARILMRQYSVWVSVENREPVKVRALVSLTADRKGEGGYRPIVNVMSENAMRRELLEDAKRELDAFKRKYAILSELAPVFEAIDQIG